MVLKFAANITTMVKDVALTSRYALFKDLGFRAVECQFPYDVPVEEIQRSKNDAGVEHVLINSFPGDLSKGQLGFAALPGHENDFIHSMELTLTYARALGCKKIHVMAGVTADGSNATQCEDVYIKNLTKAAEMLERENIIGVIEPLCKEVKQNYFLNSYAQGKKYVTQINHKNIRLLLDVFHMQMISGNLTNTIKDIMPIVGHVQISQAPNRHEPNAPGEINYCYVLDLINDHGYEDWIGLEYFPKSTTVESMSWLKEFGYAL
ncbi:putative hydroxypyruvate isomerase [Ornithodoros turicata]|uniref:putative hydroxypyruvate isomerase n=1 Tax=Ornithodoros turicata TaxID=34597 RepID=UPI00313A4851